MPPRMMEPAVARWPKSARAGRRASRPTASASRSSPTSAACHRSGPCRRQAATRAGHRARRSGRRGGLVAGRRWLAFSVAPGGGMNEQIYLVRPDGTGLRRLTDGGKENNWLGDWTARRRALAIVLQPARPGAMDTYLLRRGGRHVAPGGREPRHRRHHRRQPRRRARGRQPPGQPRRQRSLSGRRRQRQGDAADAARGPGHLRRRPFSPDGRAIYLGLERRPRLSPSPASSSARTAARADRDDRRARRRRAARASSSTTPARRPRCSGTSPGAANSRCSTSRPAGSPRPDAAGRDRRRPRLLARRQAPRHGAYRRGGARRHLGPRRRHRRAPPGDAEPARRRRPRRAGPRPSWSRFTAHDGLELSGWLYRPRGRQRPGPVVLSFHGGPGGPGAARRSTATYQALLAQGIAVFAPNVRGSSGFGKTLRQPRQRRPARRRASATSRPASITWSRAGIADPKRIGIMGGSYGGYMVMAGLTEYPDLFAAGANLFGVVNFETFFEQTEPWMAAISKVEYGDPETEADMLRELSPIHQLDRVKAPTHRAARRQRHQRAGGRGRAGRREPARSAACRSSTSCFPTRATAGARRPTASARRSRSCAGSIAT